MKYILTSQNFDGFVSYKYNHAGMLIAIEICSYNIEPGKLLSIWENYPHAITIQKLKEWVNKFPAFKIVLEPEDLSFARWWTLYNLKRNKIDAQKLWEEMSHEERAIAMVNTFAYKRYCARHSVWYNQLYPDTFLRKHWQDEWDKA